MTRQNLIAFFFAALLLFILYSTLTILSPFAQPIFWAAMIAFAFYPFYERLLRLCGNRGNLAALILTLSVFLIFAPIVIFLIIKLVHEISGLYGWLLAYINNGGFQKLIEHIHSIGWIKKIESSQFFQQEFIRENIQDIFLRSAQTMGRFVLKEAALITRNLLMGTVNFFLTMFLVFFLLRDGNKLYRFIYKITPLEEHIKYQIFSQLGETLSAVIRGQIVTALVQSTLAGLIFACLRLPLPLFFAALTFFAAMVPVFGAALIWMAFVVYLFIIKSYVSAVILLFLGTFVISMVDNFLKPLLIGTKTKLPYLLLFLGILGGLQVYGLMGAFLAPAVLSLFFVLIKIYQEEVLAEKN